MGIGKITSRQYGILKYLIEHKETYISAQEIADHLSVSARTVKSDLALVRAYAARFKSVAIEAYPGKGIFFSVLDSDLYQREMLDFVQRKSEVATPHDETTTLLQYLIHKTGYVSKYTILTDFYLSESAFYKIYQKTKGILAKFNLEMKQEKGRGYYIQGKEWDKRSFISKYELVDAMNHPLRFSDEIDYIYNTIADIFIKYEYTITYQTLQTLSSNLALTIGRVSQGHYMDSVEVKDIEHLVEYTIAGEICHKLLESHRIGRRLEYEIRVLTLNILGKINYSADKELQREISAFVDDALLKIDKKFNISFTSMEKLKLLLVLHLISLLYRIRSGTQLTNIMATEIQTKYPLANDISLYLLMLIQERFRLTCSQDELSYITLYFNLGLDELKLFSSSKKVLILAALRNSETALLRHQFLSWFPDQIIDITFENSANADLELEQFDAIFAIEQKLERYKGAVTTIKIFPDEADYKKIKLALNGYTDSQQIIEKFHPDCFFSGSVKSKEEALKIVCGNAIRTYHLQPDFFDVIKARESIESTYFGGGIAIPHPLSPITDETFVSLAILDKPIQWDDNHLVQFVMMISIECNNPKAFQFWFYMSEFVRNEKFIKALLRKPNFDYFISVLQSSLGEML